MEHTAECTGDRQVFSEYPVVCATGGRLQIQNVNLSLSPSISVFFLLYPTAF